MKELNEFEIDAVDGGWRAIWTGIAASAAWDAIKAVGSAIDDHYSQSETAFSDDPSSRGRALL